MSLYLHAGVSRLLLQLSDGEGRATRMVLWNQPGNDITGMVARVDKVVGTCEKVNRYSQVGFIPQVRQSRTLSFFFAEEKDLGAIRTRALSDKEKLSNAI